MDALRAHRPARRRRRQRDGGRAAFRRPARRHGRDVPLPDRMRHRLRPQRRAVARKRRSSLARLAIEPAAHPLRRADDVPEQSVRARPNSSTARSTLFAGEGIPVPVVSGGGTPALLTARRLPDDDRAPRRHLRLQRRDDGPSGHRDLGRLRHARPRRPWSSRPTPDRAIVDAGSKVLTHEHYYVENYRPRRRISRGASSRRCRRSTAPSTFRASAERPKVGEVVNIIPNHCCVVSNMVDEVYGIRDGTVEVVWPVAARGKVR